jgi:phage-related protein
MPSIAPGVAELRLHSGDRQFRTFYFTANTDGIQVFHALVKKTPATSEADIRLGRKRWKEMQSDEG